MRRHGGSGGRLGLLAVVMTVIAVQRLGAETVSTSFEPSSGHTGSAFLVAGATPGVAAEFTGGVAKTVGRPFLYHSGAFSWMIDGGATGTIQFTNPASDVAFWTLGVAGVDGLIEALDDRGNSLATFNTGSTFEQVQWKANLLGAPIDRIVAANRRGGRGDYLVIDDFTFTAAGLPGDFDGNGVLDLSDVNQLIAAIAGGSNNLRFDADGSGSVGQADLTSWVRDLRRTWLGDANLDGEFNSSDFVQVFQRGKFETGAQAGWDDGDWNADRVFDSGDFVVAFQDGGFERGPRAAAAHVPEPQSLVIAVLVAGFVLAELRRR